MLQQFIFTELQPVITHRRFLGYDDYKAFILIATAEEERNKEDDTLVVVQQEETINKFTCPVCQFSTDRLGILMKHNRCHGKNETFQSKLPVKKLQKRKRRKALSDDDLSEEEKKPKTKRKYTKKKIDNSVVADDERTETDISLKEATSSKNDQKPVQMEVGEKKDIRNDIIADWDNGSDHEDSSERDTMLDSTLNDTHKTADDTENFSFNDSSFVLQLSNDDLSSTRISEDPAKDPEKETPAEEKSPNKSCFDFDEDEEEAKIPDATSGRKIPRVIPISERRKTFESEDETVNEEEEKMKKKILQESEELAKLTVPSMEDDKETENLEKTYQSLMDSTENLDIPDVPNILKNEQNFHSARTVKYPDKTKGESFDFIEAEVDEEKKKQFDETEKEKLLSVEEISEKPDNVEDKIMEEQSLPVHQEKVTDDKIEQSPKGKIKRTNKYKKKGRKSSKSKREITESDIDALMLQQAVESKNEEEKESDSSTNQVPLDVPSVSTEEKDGIHEKLFLNEEILTEEISVCEENVDLCIGEEQVLSIENDTSKVEEDKTLQEMETSRVSMEVTPAVKQPICISEGKTSIPIESSEKKGSKIEIDPDMMEIKSFTVEDDNEPARKKPKITRSSSKSLKNKEDSSLSNRRGRSKEAGISKLQKNKSSSSEPIGAREQSKSRSIRKLSRWDTISTKEDDDTPQLDISLGESTPSQEEINNVILGRVEVKENITVHTEDTPEKETLEESTKNDVELPENQREKSVAIPTIPAIPEENQLNEDTESPKKEISQSLEPEPEKSKSNKKDTKQIQDRSPEKNRKSFENSTKDNDKDHKSHRTPRKDKKSSRSDKDNKKDETSLSEDSSSHRSSRNSRRSDRHEKEKQNSSEKNKTDQPDKTQIKHPKDSSSSRKSGSSKNSHNFDLATPSSIEQEENVPRRSSRKDKTSDDDSFKHKTSPVKDNRKEHSSYSRSSKRQSRSSKSSHDSIKWPDAEANNSSDKKSEGNTSLDKEENVKKSPASTKKMEKAFNQDKIDPMRDLFSPSETIISKTKEQKREELKSIFSFDYNEKKRKTYGHKRKPKPINEDNNVSEEPLQNIPTEGISEESNLKTSNLENKDEERKQVVSEPSSEENKIDDKPMAVPIESEPSESVEIQNEVEIDVGVEEIAISVETSESVSMPDVQTEKTEFIETHQSENTVKTDVAVTEVRNDKPTEPLDNEIQINTSKDEAFDNSGVESCKKLETEDTVMTENKEGLDDFMVKGNNSETVSKSPTKKARKPSRWDQKEKTNKSSSQSQRKSRWDTSENKDENQQSSEDVAIASTENSLVTLGVDETSQKEMSDIFSQKESSELALKNAAQIELIFGSSPLPGLSENNIFSKENIEVETTNMQEKTSNLDRTENEEKNDETPLCSSSSPNSSFEHCSDALESVESQIARITHYEEPNLEKKVPKEEKKVASIFDTPEKNEKTTSSCLDSPKEDIEVVAHMSNEESTESSTISVPKTKKFYILKEKTKKDITEHSLTVLKEEPSSSIQDAPVKSLDKTKEVATKLTNPKKRFAKSFEDSELIKQREKSMVTDKLTPTEPKPGTSLLTGKSPIAFKLKKQILSKICSIFDEPDETKEIKLNKLEPIEHDILVQSKKEGVTSESNETSSLKMETQAKKISETVGEITADIQIEDNTEITNVDHSSLKCNSASEEVSQEIIKSDMQVNDEVTTDNSTLGVNQFSENSTEYSTDSAKTDTGKLEESKPIAVQESLTATKVLEKHEDDIVISTTEIVTKNFPINDDKKEETEYVSIDGNLTVVSEKELAEGQVEITAIMPSKKPTTLLNFSMDFSDESSDASFEVFTKEKLQDITKSLVTKTVEDIKISDETNQTKVANNESRLVANAEQVVVNAENQTANMNKQIPETTMEDDEVSHEENEVEKVITDDKSATVIHEQKDLTDTNTDRKEKTSEVSSNVTKELQTETSLNITTPEIKEEKTEIKIQAEEKEKVITKQTDSDLFPILDEVKPSKSSDVSTRSKGKDSSKKKILKNDDIAAVNEPLVIYNIAKSSTVTDMCDLEDHIPSQIVCTKINEEVMKVAGINNELTKEGTILKKEPEMSKLLSRLTSDKKEDSMSKMRSLEVDARTSKLEQSTPRNLLKAVVKGKSVHSTPAKSSNKAIILSEKIIRPAREVVPTKRTYEDVEDIAPYIIAKVPKLESKTEEAPGIQKVASSSLSKSSINSSRQFIINAANKQVIGIKKPTGKAKILNQTIIRPAGEGIQTNKTVTEDNVDFDINSMPIVLSDELLTPETLESIPIVLGEQAQKAVPASENMKIVIERKPQTNSKQATKTVPMPSSASNFPLVRTPILKKTTPKILQTPKTAQKIIRQITPSSGSKPGKFVVVSDSPNRTAQLLKKQPNLLRKAVPVSSATSTSTSAPTESTGHKIMIFTNQQGKQQRLLLTPAQQKMFGMQLPGKTVVKGATVAQKSQLVKVQTSTLASTSKLPGQSIQSSKLVKTAAGTAQIASPQMKIVPPRKNQKIPIPNTAINKPLQQKTILITNQHGQTVRKIQGTNEALLDKQVAEQLEAIKVSSLKAQQKQQEVNVRGNVVNKPHVVPPRKAMVKRPETKQMVVAPTKPSHSPVSLISGSSKLKEPKVPPLTPIKQDKKVEEPQNQTPQAKSNQNKPDRPLHQLVIQDNLGNQTTITEGQILALPSETVDGQPQSYMLVTLDETGNLTPLNNEALMSLDPSLAGLAGGDLSNMVLQMDAGTSKDNVNQTAQLQAAPTPSTVQEKPKQTSQHHLPPSKPVQQIVPPVEQPAAQVQVTCNINGENGQQIILTGDPAATQKFLDSLSDGSTDLANILAGAEGNSFLIQADGQQILINTEPTEAPMLQQPEQGNPMFSTHPPKNQDILAAALADTDVFQQDQVASHGKLTHSQLSPGQTLFPMNVGNVLETSLTLNSPIMTPLEVPSTNTKRIPDDEADILTTHVPKNVDLPITITDPNISQTVSHQHVLMASDLRSNLELSLPISETNISVTSDINSPSFVYSLPNLEVSEHAEISHKSYSSSMPLLTEDEESHAFVSIPSKSGEVQESSKLNNTDGSVLTSKKHIEKQTLGRRLVSGGTFMEEGLCNLGSEMCSSLSEPPPEMFDIPIENDSLNFLSKSDDSSKEKSTGLSSDDNSLEISVQSQVVSDFKDSSQSSDSSSSLSQDKTL